MTEQLANLHRLFESFPLRPIHTSPLIHKANDYYHWSYEDRRYLFNRMFAFIRHCPISYRTFIVEKRLWEDNSQLTGRLARDLPAFRGKRFAG